MTLVAQTIQALKNLSASERATFALALKTDTNAVNAAIGTANAGDLAAVGGTISGTVTHAGGNIDGGVVVATNAGGEIFAAKTAADGTYSMPVSAGTYALVFAKAAFVLGATASSVVASGATVDEDKILVAVV